ncbi:MAG: VanZ family protein, partial [Bacteroides sp.]
MFNFFKRYFYSSIVVTVALYLSLFKPPETSLDKIPNFDKVVHICMYLGLSGVIWIEYMRSHRQNFCLKRALLGAFVFPILFSGSIELIQEYGTTYRGGDWLDFAANVTGVIIAALIAHLTKSHWLKAQA